MTGAAAEKGPRPLEKQHLRNFGKTTRDILRLNIVSNVRTVGIVADDKNRNTPMHRRIYKNPPIQEALCEFYFSPFQSWDPERMARIYRRIKGIYDGQPTQELVPQTIISEDGNLNQIT